MTAPSWPSIRWSSGLATGKSAALRAELRARMRAGRRPLRYVSATSDVGLRAERVHVTDPATARVLGLEALQGRLVRTLSSGERQRVRLALALSPDGADIALDEATRHLDPVTVTELAALLGERRASGASLLVCDVRRALPSKLFDKDGVPTDVQACQCDRLVPGATEVEIPVVLAGDRVQGHCVPQRLALAEGALACVAGPNGAGKTTLLQALHMGAAKLGLQVGLSRQDLEVQILAPSPRAELRAVLRDRPLAPWLHSVLGNGGDGPIESRLSSWVGLEPWLDTPMGEVPLGALALLGVALAATLGRDLVLLDEPTQGLDERLAQKVASCLCEAASAGARLVVASHDPALWRVSSERWQLSHGAFERVPVEDTDAWKAAS